MSNKDIERDPDIGNRLRFVLSALGCRTEVDGAALLGCSEAALQRYFAGEPMPLRHQRRLIERGISLNWLLSAGGTMPPRINGKNVGRTCSEPGCKRPAIARGMCMTHYSQKWRASKTAEASEGAEA